MYWQNLSIIPAQFLFELSRAIFLNTLTPRTDFVYQLVHVC